MTKDYINVPGLELNIAKDQVEFVKKLLASGGIYNFRLDDGTDTGIYIFTKPDKLTVNAKCGPSEAADFFGFAQIFYKNK